MTWQRRMRFVTDAFDDLETFERCTIKVGATKLEVAIARTPRQWALGLTAPIARGLDGMLFVAGEGARTTGFHLATVNYPILISFFSPEGTLIHADLMTTKKPRCHPPAPYSHAVELNATKIDPLILVHLAKGFAVPDTSSG